MILKKLAHRQLAYFEALRKLGYSSDDIYVYFQGGELFTQLHQGEKRFNITVSRGVTVNPDEYQVFWKKQCVRWNTVMKEAERMKIYRAEFPTSTKLLSLTTALIDKGFTVPNLQRDNVHP